VGRRGQGRTRVAGRCRRARAAARVRGEGPERRR
jgi:hypothetical protein